MSYGTRISIDGNEIAEIQPIAQPERKRFWFRTAVSLELLRKWPQGFGSLEDFVINSSIFHGHAARVDVLKAGPAADDAIEVTILGEANFFPGLT